jgi:hypothetical protein
MGVAAGVAELGADVSQVGVHGAVGDVALVGVGALHQLLAAVHAPRLAQQGGDQPELGGGQLDLGAGDEAAVAGGVEPERAVGEHLLGGRGRLGRAGAAQDRLDPTDQLAGGERLGEVVVAADLQADDAVELLAARREEDDRHLAEGADAAAGLQAVQLGHQHVHDDEIGRLGAGEGHGGGAVGRLQHLPALAGQRVAHDLAQVGVVVDDEHAGLGHPASWPGLAPMPVT